MSRHSFYGDTYSLNIGRCCAVPSQHVMLSSYFVDFKTILAGQMEAALSLMAATAAIVFLLIFARQGSAQHPPYFLLAASIFGVVSSFIIVASRHGLLSWSKAGPVSDIFTYLFFVCGIQQLLNFARNYCTSRFSTESRFISTLYLVINIFTVATLIAAICSYSIQLFFSVNQLYSMEKILKWGFNVLQWCPTTMMIISKVSYRHLAPKEDIQKPNINRSLIFGLFIVMLAVCEMHGMLLLFYPPTDWTDMAGVVAVGFVIGTMYYQAAVPKHIPGCEPIYKHLASEKLPLTNRDNL